MLQIIIPAEERWDEEHEEFIVSKKEQKLMLEHSLVSLSKWESKWQVPFLSKKEKTYEETLDYIKCMTITQNVSDDVYKRLTSENLMQIRSYMESPMTATSIHDEPAPKNRSEILTSEVIYNMMIAFNIPFEGQKWHLNRLFTLIKVCELKNRKPKKKSLRDIMQQNTAINEMRKKKYNTRG